jgi:hypothetical protein
VRAAPLGPCGNHDARLLRELDRFRRADDAERHDQRARRRLVLTTTGIRPRDLIEVERGDRGAGAVLRRTALPVRADGD